MYKICNVSNLGPHDEYHATLESAEAYMRSRGYVYVTSATFGSNGEDAYYYTHPDHAEEHGIDTNREGWEFSEDLLDSLYGYGYEPCVIPRD
jgi:hypothetical protein